MTTEHGVDKRATAIHEAGHAVIGRVLGLLCGGATIIQDEDSAGHAITNDPWAILFAWETRGKYRETETAFRAPGKDATAARNRRASLRVLGKPKKS